MNKNAMIRQLTPFVACRIRKKAMRNAFVCFSWLPHSLILKRHHSYGHFLKPQKAEKILQETPSEMNFTILNQRFQGILQISSQYKTNSPLKFRKELGTKLINHWKSLYRHPYSLCILNSFIQSVLFLFFVCVFVVC